MGPSMAMSHEPGISLGVVTNPVPRGSILSSSHEEHLRSRPTAILASTGLACPALAASAASFEPDQRSETLVTQFYDSLSEDQRRTVVLPFDSPLRSRVENNWHITNARVGRFFNRGPAGTDRRDFRRSHAPEFRESLARHVADDFGSVRNLSVALFGSRSPESSNSSSRDGTARPARR